ncbi:hypothetical protein C1X35_09755 [Pseudomonas sp. FW306-1C-G01A]|nr:hypothetical protein C1X56_05805 [Pseudomonas sp. GW101-1A09]PMV98711.1 hypothetical protein C1X51_01800 [Pseudomonas sp. FW306-2-2C-B10A]PMW01979.1 hypothetical protein C1X55_04730 [Pseudomonas sp. GW460-C8]PMW02631.1 hypothetical protein C1X50_24815 [Pseudomonas sp. MPR-TSA4]PMW14509.1 hypothetical protein C1X52_15175 [Pseudomonas sp. FW306-2-1A-C05A]PMW19335.1 hypothetical protein C1X40_13570 [Pseudomonas sp. GW456-11-11-14-TSB2]PMW24662.1 hypothetical protein C1X53_08750 [Pseudomonas s
MLLTVGATVRRFDLLAMAVGQSISVLNNKSLSRAGSLPQGGGWCEATAWVSAAATPAQTARRDRSH